MTRNPGTLLKRESWVNTMASTAMADAAMTKSVNCMLNPLLTNC